MCQLNSYFVPKKLSKKKVLEIMKAAGMDCCEYMSDYEKMPEFKEYNAFFSAPQRCNCGSIMSKLQDGGYKSFEEYKVLSVRYEVARLEQIRDFMLTDGYTERRRTFETERLRLSGKMREQSAWIGEKEQALIHEIMIRDISDEEKSRLMHETVYPVIHKLLEENEQKPEVIKTREEYQKFLSDNDLMWNSWAYTLEKAAPQIHPAMPLTLKTVIELSGYEPEENEKIEVEEDEVFTITVPSNNIFDVIEAAKNKDFSDCISEFESIDRFIKAVLTYTDTMMLFAYWQTDNCNIIGKQTISIKDFGIDNLLLLPYLTLLEIRK